MELEPFNEVAIRTKSLATTVCSERQVIVQCSHPWRRMQVEGKQNNHCRNKQRSPGFILVGGDLQILIWSQTSSWTRRGWLEEALLPTELMRTEWSTKVRSGLGLQFDKLE